MRFDYKIENGVLVDIEETAEGESEPRVYILPEGITAVAGHPDGYLLDFDGLFLPASLTEFDANAIFPASERYLIAVAEGNRDFFVRGDCLIRRRDNTLVLGCTDSVIPDDGSVEVIGAGAFFALESLENIHIPTTVKRIESRAFAGTGLHSLELPASVEYIASDALCTPDIRMLSAEGNPYYSVENGCLIDRRERALVAACSRDIIAVPRGVEKLLPWALSCRRCCIITLPESVKDIGVGNFSCCGYEEEGTVWPQALVRVPEGSPAQAWCKAEGIPYWIRK